MLGDGGWPVWASKFWLSERFSEHLPSARNGPQTFPRGVCELHQPSPTPLECIKLISRMFPSENKKLTFSLQNLAEWHAFDGVDTWKLESPTGQCCIHSKIQLIWSAKKLSIVVFIYLSIEIGIARGLERFGNVNFRKWKVSGQRSISVKLGWVNKVLINRKYIARQLTYCQKEILQHTNNQTCPKGPINGKTF